MGLNISSANIPHYQPEWTPEGQWREVDEVLALTRQVLIEQHFSDDRIRQLDRSATNCQSRNPHFAMGVLQELSAAICDEMRHRVYFSIDPSHTGHIKEPLERYGEAASKFRAATRSMEGASRCFALDEWDAAVFHSMGVLEHGLRWLAAQINAGPFPLTLSKPVEFETWETIIGNIQARIDEEMRAKVPRTEQRDKDLKFLGDAAAEFRYFKEAWRNHVAHNRHAPFDRPTAESVMDHVATFMKILAGRA